VVLVAAGEAIRNGAGGTIKNLSNGKIIVAKKNIVENQGSIENQGEIIIEEESNLDSEGNINNEGTITSYGQISKLNQSNLGGILIIDTEPGNQTNVPTIDYNNLQLKGLGNKIFDASTNGSVRTLTYFSSDDSTPILYNPEQTLVGLGTVNHDGNTNPGQDYGRIGLYGNQAQDIYGTGIIRELELNNLEGADVINGGGFSVTHRLDLANGDLRNSIDNNFNLGGDGSSSTTITKSNGTLAIHPNNPNDVDLTVTYLENSGTRHTTGGEIPDNDSIFVLGVENSLGLELTKDINVEDSIYVGSTIRTYSDIDPDNAHTLALYSDKDPVFENTYSEIDGKFKRTNLPPGLVRLFNNRHTSVQFADNDSKGDLASVTMDIRPDTQFDDPAQKGETKVRRTFDISGEDVDGNSVEEGFNMQVQYAWIHRPPFGTSGNETFEEGMEGVDEFVFQEWQDGGRWVDVKNGQGVNTPVDLTDWVYSTIMISDMGEFGIGFPALDYLYIMANAILEGPFRPSAGIMDTTLFKEASDTPPDIYPYNLDPNREKIVKSPEVEGIVDWVVLEFRSGQTEQFQADDSVFYRTCLLRYDGELVDADGRQGVTLPKELTMNAAGNKSIDTTGQSSYYITVRHRNHLAIVTQNSFTLTRDFAAQQQLNFNDPAFVLGGAKSKDPEIWDIDELTGSVLKIISFDDGNAVYGIAAGMAGEYESADRRWIIGSEDLDYVWENINSEGYFYNGLVNNADYNMDGIVNTLDFNVSWNNRKRAAEVDRIE